MLPIPTFVINLERDITRRRHMQEALGSLGITPQFVTAVDGHRMSERDRSVCDRARSLAIYGREMMDTEIACHLSHYRLYQRMVDEGIDTALIMEDDVYVERMLPSVVRDLLQCRNADWLVVRLDSKRAELHDPPSAKFRGTRVADLPGGASLYRLRTHVLGVGAYLVRRHGAERLLNYGKRVFLPIDQAMDRYWENGIVPFIVRPFPVQQREEFGSSTGLRPALPRRRQPFPLRSRMRLQRAMDSISKRVFSLVHGI
jgi:glycosyl transferase family 25